jgi:hypothetical protein
MVKLALNRKTEKVELKAHMPFWGVFVSLSRQNSEARQNILFDWRKLNLILMKNRCMIQRLNLDPNCKRCEWGEGDGLVLRDYP